MGYHLTYPPTLPPESYPYLHMGLGENMITTEGQSEYLNYNLGVSSYMTGSEAWPVIL